MFRRGLGRASASCVAVAAAAVLLVPPPAMADRHTAGLGGGGGRSGGSSLWGVILSGDLVLGEGKTTAAGTTQHSQWSLSLATEASQASGEHDGGTLSRTTLLLGPRFMLNEFGSFWAIQPYVHVLGGRWYERLLESESGWAAAFGGGVDIPLESTKTRHPRVVARLQFSRHWLENGTRDWYNQSTLAIIFRINKGPKVGP
jgi:hypothetical protein